MVPPMSTTTPPIRSASSSVATTTFRHPVSRRARSTSSFRSAAVSGVAERMATRARPSPRAGHELAHEPLVVLGADRAAEKGARLAHRLVDHLGAERLPGGDEFLLCVEASVGPDAVGGAATEGQQAVALPFSRGAE